MEYSASCYLESRDGQYHMECDMQTDDREAYAEYDGDNFVEGLNHLLDELYTGILEEPEPESESMTLEEQVEYLTNQVNSLKEENQYLIDLILSPENKDEDEEDSELDSDMCKDCKDYEDCYGDKLKTVNYTDLVQYLNKEADRLLKNYNTSKIPTTTLKFL